MSARAALRTAVVLFWLTFIAVIISSAALESFLPLELQEHLDVEAGLEIGARDIVIGGALLLVLLGFVLASIGLLLLQRWGAKLFLYLTILFCLLSCYAGPTVDHAVAAALQYVFAMLHGGIIALSFFSNAFEPVVPPRPEIPPGADVPTANA